MPGSGQPRGSGNDGGHAHETLRAFGLSLSTSERLPGAWVGRRWTEPGLDLRIVERAAISAHWSGSASIGWQARIDGAPFVVELGSAGDHRFVHGERAVCHLAADGALLRCALRDDSDRDGDNGDARAAVDWRVVLDSVLFSVALLRGYEALHAGAVATAAGAVAIAAGAGGGKSTLLAELIDRGQALLSDDVVALEPTREARPLAHPGPPLMTLPARASQDLGPTIASIADERWVAVATHGEAIPLAALVLLDRRAGLSTELLPLNAPLVPLLSSLLAFPRTAERERARFELAGALASHTPVWRLTADPGVAPQILGELILADLPALTGAASLR
jgi:hypothetical protein